jgi:hypothetical protein
MTPSGADTKGDAFVKTWEYACVVGMLVYLAATTRPDIAYAVHHAAMQHSTRTHPKGRIQ